MKGTHAHQGIHKRLQQPDTVQIVVDEAELQYTASEVALKLAAGHVRGVWEERLPLSLHTTLTLGCVTALLPAARSRPLSEGFSISDLQV